jgi:hypothetical protein
MAKKSTPGDGSHGRGVKGGRTGPYDSDADRERFPLRILTSLLAIRRILGAKTN